MKGYLITAIVTRFLQPVWPDSYSLWKGKQFFYSLPKSSADRFYLQSDIVKRAQEIARYLDYFCVKFFN